MFEQVASTSSSTVPGHASILTGKYPFAHGARSNAGFVLSESNDTWAEILAAAKGYRTHAEIAAPVLSRTTGLDQGFDRYRDLDSDGIRTLAIGTSASRSASGAPTTSRAPASPSSIATARDPFFLWLHYFDPHRVYVKRPEFEAAFDEDPYRAEVLFTDQQVGRFLRGLEIARDFATARW